MQLLNVVGFALALLFATLAFPSAARANQSAQQAYCAPPVVPQQGQVINAPPLAQDLSHAEQCGGQYGDLWTDGPLYSPSFSFNALSFYFTIPQQVWIANGNRVFTSMASETAPASTTSYWWLEADTSTYTCTTNTSQPYTVCSGFPYPDSSSVLEYTIVASNQGISSVTNPTLASESINGAFALAQLPSGSCLQTSTNGVVTATGAPCGSGSSGIVAVNGTGNISVSTVSGTATVSTVSSPTFTGSVSAGSATAYIPTGSFLSSSDSTTSGKVYVGGVSSYCPLDYGDTTAGDLTIGCPTVISSGNSLTVPTINKTSTTVTGGFINAGTLGSATSAVMRFGNANSSGYTSIGSGTDSVAGVTTSLLGFGNTGTAKLTFDLSGDEGLAGNVAALGSVVAGYATAPSVSSGDGAFSRSTTTGALSVGGSSNSCQVDYNVSLADMLTSGCGIHIPSISGGNGIQVDGLDGITAGETIEAGVHNGSPSLMVGGSLASTTASGAGILYLGSGIGTSLGTLDFGRTNAHVFTFENSPVEVAGETLIATSSTSGSNEPLLNAGDIGASEGASSGQFCAGGSTSEDCWDYGVTTAGVGTFSKPIAVKQLFQVASNDFAGTCTNSSGTTCTFTIAAGYTSTPICQAQDTSSSNKVDSTCALSGTTVTVTNAGTTFNGSCTTSGASCTISAPYAFSSGYTCIATPSTSASEPVAICSLSSTTITVTAASAGSNAYGVILRGIPSATGHTLSGVLTGNPS